MVAQVSGWHNLLRVADSARGEGTAGSGQGGMQGGCAGRQPPAAAQGPMLQQANANKPGISGTGSTACKIGLAESKPGKLCDAVHIQAKHGAHFLSVAMAMCRASFTALQRFIFLTPSAS